MALYDTPFLKIILEGLQPKDWRANYVTVVRKHIAHIRPTTPIRDPKKIDEAIVLFQNNQNYDSLRSVHQMSESSYKTLEINDGKLTPLSLFNNKGLDVNAPRQNFPNTYHANGYIDILCADSVKKNKSIHGNNILPFITNFSLEVDTIEDLEYLEFLASNKSDIVKKLFKKK